MGLRKKVKHWLHQSKKPPSNTLGLQFEPFGWLLSRDPTGLVETTLTSGETAEDKDLVRRVMKAYQRADAAFEATSSFWDKGIRNLNQNIHDALSGEDVDTAAALLRNPADTNHFWGFDAVCSAPAGKIEPHISLLSNLNSDLPWEQLYGLWVLNALADMADAIGVRRVNSAESGDTVTKEHLTADQLLDRIEDEIGHSISFPNPFPHERGVPTKRGVASFRAVQSLYQGWRISDFMHRSGKADFRVLEIGAGLGRTAFYAHQFGVPDYTIIDLPMTGSAQGYFLGRTLGADIVSLGGESSTGSVHILPSTDLEDLEGRFDLIANIDSFTEMDRETATNYWKFAKARTNLLYSINHEANHFTVRDIYSEQGDLDVVRTPYWLRKGYVEEIVRFP